MKALIIEISLLAAVTGFILCCAGIEGTAPIPACVLGQTACLGWMALVIYANR